MWAVVTYFLVFRKLFLMLSIPGTAFSNHAHTFIFYKKSCKIEDWPIHVHVWEVIPINWHSLRSSYLLHAMLAAGYSTPEHDVCVGWTVSTAKPSLGWGQPGLAQFWPGMIQATYKLSNRFFLIIHSSMKVI